MKGRRGRERKRVGKRAKGEKKRRVAERERYGKRETEGESRC